MEGGGGEGGKGGKKAERRGAGRFKLFVCWFIFCFFNLVLRLLSLPD